MSKKVMRAKRFCLLIFPAFMLALLNSNACLDILSSLFSLRSVSADSSAENALRYGSLTMAEAVRQFRGQTQVCLPAEMISVIVVGEVVYPGTYELCRPVTALGAVLSAGGPGPGGSFRKVRVFFDSMTREYDIYDFFRTGKDNSPVLNGGETVVLAPVMSQIHIGGKIKSPGIYELKPEESCLSQAVLAAGGLSVPDETACTLDVFRADRRGYKHVFSQKLGNEALEKSGFQQFWLENGDRVEIQASANEIKKTIEMQGFFRSPGKIVSAKELRLSDLIIRENLQPGFCGRYAELLRPESERKEYSVVEFSPNRILDGSSETDPVLQHGDCIVVFSESFFQDMVKVAIEQEIKGKQVFSWREGLRISDLINLAGGLGKDYSPTAELIRKEISSDGLKTRSIIIDLTKVWQKDPRYDLALEPFDLLVISLSRQK